MIKARYIHPDDRPRPLCHLKVKIDGSTYLTRTEAVVLKMQLEEVIKKIDGERK